MEQEPVSEQESGPEPEAVLEQEFGPESEAVLEQEFGSEFISADHNTPLRFKIIDEYSSYVKKFQMHGLKITFKITDPPEDVAEMDWIQDAFSDIISYIKKDCNPSDFIGLTFHSQNFEENSPGWIKFQTCSQLQAADIWHVLFSLLQSRKKDGINTTDTFRICATRVEMPTGKMPRRRKGYYNNYHEECSKRKGIISINNNDDLCLPRALVVGQAYAENNRLKKKISQNIHKMQDKRVEALLEESSVEIPPNGAGIAELEKFQEVMQKFQIVVYKYNTGGTGTIFEGIAPNADKRINLLQSEKHYNVITSLTSAFSCSYFCEPCKIKSSHIEEHRCPNKCKACLHSPPCEKADSIEVCEVCNRNFYSRTCFENHLRIEICNYIKKCRDCHKVYNTRARKNAHICDEIYCQTCQLHKPPDHQCYIRKDGGKPPTDKFVFVFFDLETRQEKDHPTNENMKIHEPNLCVAQQRCFKCIEDPQTQCEECCKTKIFEGSDAVPKFMDYVLNIRKKFKKVCVISHNGQAFDVQFILKYILEETGLSPDVIMRGTKIILLEIDNVRFIDSLNYFPMALSKLPEAFDLSTELKKGYFPHLFNTSENALYVGNIPEKKYYSPETMKEEERDKFIKWHNDQIEKKLEFNMKEEMLAYCKSDVKILQEACLKFRKYFLKECNVDPFLERKSITIASAGHLVFRRNFLKSNTIGLIPPGGYRKKYNQSKVAIEWLISEKHKRNLEIHHEWYLGEKKIKGMKVDGYCEETREVFEFHGCYFHGCPKCYPLNRDKPCKEDPSQTMQMKYERTVCKTNSLRKLGYTVHEMWECQFRREKRNNNLGPSQEFLELQETPLDPRDAFYGGRTGCTKLYHKVEENEKIFYVDVCSLYPYVCKYGKYPVGHPKIYVGDFQCQELTGPEYNLERIEGLVKCSVLPPQDLYHPVLPVKQNDKLMFILCRTCGETQNQNECEHDDSERILHGVWVADELRKAISKGYRIVKISEIWQYEISQYDRNTKSGGLFTEYINKFLKMKQQASGFPSDCSTKEQMEEYVNEYFEKEGVQLELDEISKNPALRSLGKLILNSFWGRFGMRENLPKTTIIKSAAEFFRMLLNNATQINVVNEINNETILMNWEFLEEVMESSPTVNVVLATYTTAQARLKLYEKLEGLDRQVLYYDTDSIIYSYKPGQRKILTGRYLGDWTDELEGYGVDSYITEFVSGGPKTYGYKVYTPGTGSEQYICKVKGITLNFETSFIVNFEKLKEMVTKCSDDDDGDTSIVVNSKNIARTKKIDVVTADVSRTLTINILKRRRVDDFDTEPYGFKRMKE